MSLLSKARVKLGPPGTGKTTALMNELEELLEAGVRSDEIAFVSYTTAATNEARDRACKRFGLGPEQFPFFRTIHSMAYMAMADRPPVMEDKDWKSFGESCAYSFSDFGPTGEDSLNFDADGDALKSIDHIARTTRTTVAEAMIRLGDSVPPHVTEAMVTTFRKRLADWKLENGKIDFDDMLEAGLLTDWRPSVRFAFADEAQDNSRMQNSLLRHWFLENPRCEQLTYAGDDDQGIHAWAGAEKRDLLYVARHAQTEILAQSWRIPSMVHAMALSIIRQNKDRIDKRYAPRAELGSVSFVDDVSKAIAALGNGSTLALVRTRAFAATVREACLHRGMLFSSEVGAASPLDRKASRGAFDAISSWRRESNASAVEFRGLLSLVPSGKGKDRILPVGAKSKADKNTEPVPVWRARDEFGLGGILPSILGPRPFDVLSKLPPDERDYLDKVFHSDATLAGPQVVITTEHRSKGREADNVVLVSDIGPRCARGRDASVSGFEGENCVAYVAATRAKSNLVVVRPASRHFYDFSRHARSGACAA
jgi:DNA helicase II / ATP-dependent DNA helicase PcrA